MATQSFIVIGGGIVGAASALRLRAAGFDVLLIDPGDARRGASFGNAGHIGAEQCDPWPSIHNLVRFPRHLFFFGGPLDFPLSQMGKWLPWSLKFIRAAAPSNFARGQKALKSLLAEPIAAWQRLFVLAGAPSLVVPSGHLVVWMSERGAESGIAAWRKADTGTATFREIDRAELAELGAAMRSAPVAGLRVSGTGQMREPPQAVREALLSAFRARGGTVFDTSVSKMSTTDVQVSVFCTNGTRADADALLITAGAWSHKLMAQLGVTVPLIAERGYHVQSDVHDWPKDLPPTVFEEHFVIVTRFGDALRSTSFLEFGDADAPPDPSKWLRLERRLGELGIKFSESPERWMGSRPTLPDYLPAIGRLASNPRVLYAFGHQHLGLTMAAITSELVEALATARNAPIDLNPLRIERF